MDVSVLMGVMIIGLVMGNVITIAIMKIVIGMIVTAMKKTLDVTTTALKVIQMMVGATHNVTLNNAIGMKEIAMNIMKESLTDANQNAQIHIYQIMNAIVYVIRNHVKKMAAIVLI